MGFFPHLSIGFLSIGFFVRIVLSTGIMCVEILSIGVLSTVGFVHRDFFHPWFCPCFFFAEGFAHMGFCPWFFLPLGFCPCGFHPSGFCP